MQANGWRVLEESEGRMMEAAGVGGAGAEEEGQGVSGPLLILYHSINFCILASLSQEIPIWTRMGN